MQIKHSQHKSLPVRFMEKLWEKSLCRLICILLCAFLLVLSGYLFHRQLPLGPALRGLNLPGRVKAIVARVSRPPIERITIDIEHKDYMQLAYQREIALQRHALVAGSDDFVPATIRHDNRSVKVKLRLKGDMPDHLEEGKWSFRIKVKGDSTLFGMKEFSIQHPKTRNYVYEWIFQQALKREGIISLRYDFIDVTLNGKNVGVYALEENFDKRLIEHNRLREGPIVRFNEKMNSETTARLWEGFPGWPVQLEGPIFGDSSYLSSDIDAFQTEQINSDPSSYAQYQTAVYLLESFRRGELKRSEAFDIQKYAAYLAITDLMGAHHSVDWTNSRFYYNPITSRLEPIGYDGEPGQLFAKLSVNYLDWWSTNKAGPHWESGHRAWVFDDWPFIEAYVKSLERISQPSYLDTLLSELSNDLNDKLNVLYSEFPDSDFVKDIFYENQYYMRMVINPVKGLQPYYRQSSQGQIELALANTQSIPIVVLKLSSEDAAFEPFQETILSAKHPSNLMQYVNASFVVPEDFSWSDSMLQSLKIHYKLLGSSRERQEDVFAAPPMSDVFVDEDFARQEPNVETFDFLDKDEGTKSILVRPGTWRLDRSLVIPAGYKLIVRKCTELDLSNSGKIVSFSPVEFLGSKDCPILIQSTDSTGQGIVVINSDRVSILKHVTFYNLSNPVQAGWGLTGAITFYESPVVISDSRFVNSRSEDALNLVRSEFTIIGTVFSGSAADAIDADFTKGDIIDSTFTANGNDAVDISGSVLKMRNVSITGGGDKGLSAGEGSQVTIDGMEIEGCQIAIASKDLSNLEMQRVRISDCEIGLSAYQKKPEFGPGVISAEELEMIKVNIPYLVEKGSTVTVDGVAMPPARENVEEILYGVEFGKASN